MSKGNYSLDEALALIIASTHTRKRPVSIVEIARAIDVAAESSGSVEKLADQIGLSSKMLRQFMQVNQLSETVRSLVAQRRIDSVDAVSHIARLQDQDQEAVAKRFADGVWDTYDVRAFCELKALKPSASNEDLAEQVQSSKSIQEFVFEFIRRQGITQEDAIRKLSAFIDFDAIKRVVFEGSKGSLVLDLRGRDQLRQIAKSRSVPIREIIPNLLYF